MQTSPTIGVLALQGDYESHAVALAEAGATPKLVRTAQELKGVQGLVIPGGESTTFLKFLEREGMLDALRATVALQPTFGTCAGCILLAKEVVCPAQESLGVLDATVERNAYGRQVDSSIQVAETSLPGGPLEMVYIRAPRIRKVGPEVEIFAERDGFPVLVRQKNILAATFHPELSADRRVHRYFVQMVEQSIASTAASPAAPSAISSSRKAVTQL